jgi:FkbM family methyltransferase
VLPRFLDKSLIPQGLVERKLADVAAPVLCDPYILMHRAVYWCGHLYESAVEQLLRNSLRPGDTLLDVGANVGHIAVLGACLVGIQGRVLGFEADPRLAALLSSHVEKHALSQVTIFGCGLGDARGSFKLRVNPRHLGGNTLRELGDEEKEQRFTEERDCKLEVGDEVLANVELPGNVFLKLDVEGSEIRVLRGMPRILERVSRAVVEVTPEWLGGVAGVEEMFELMARAGLASRRLENDGAIGPPLRASEIDEQTNVVFTRG